MADGSLSQVITGDCLRVLRSALAEPDSIDAVITDPPYGLGFMNKAWDRSVPGVEFWEAMLRVAKPGAHLLAFGGTRTHHRMMCAIEDAGWELRDTIMWVYGSGFPKSHNLGDGRGTALKPAWEPIIMARKPLVGTVAANVEQFGTGALNIDMCRVGTESTQRARTDGDFGLLNDDRWQPKTGINGSTSGRWPANLIHDGSDEVLAAFPDAPGQQGVAKNDGTASGNAVYSALHNVAIQPEPRIEADKSAARFFYCAKASKADRGEGNNHPTVKPTALMRYLVRLVTPRGGTVLDPFCGSGSTGKGTVLEWCNFIGIDLEAEFTAIADRRIAHAQRHAA